MSFNKIPPGNRSKLRNFIEKIRSIQKNHKSIINFNLMKIRSSSESPHIQTSHCVSKITLFFYVRFHNMLLFPCKHTDLLSYSLYKFSRFCCTIIVIAKNKIINSLIIFYYVIHFFTITFAYSTSFFI